MRGWLLGIFLASLLLSVTVHVTFQLGVANRWHSETSVPRELANGLPSRGTKSMGTVTELKAPPLRRRSFLEDAVFKKAAEAATATVTSSSAVSASTLYAARQNAMMRTTRQNDAVETTSQKLEQPIIPTLDCEALLRDAKEHRLEFRDPNTGKDPSTYQRRTVPMSPNDETFYISLHVPNFDPVRWKIMTMGIYYERTLESIWRRVLKNSPPNSHVLDVGANIGYFSLVSMAAAIDPTGIVVDAFEPNPVNLLRTCESLALNNWTRSPTDNPTSPGLHLHAVGVSDTNEVLPFVTNRVNPGQSQFASSVEEAQQLVTTSKGVFQRSADKSVITLDAFATSRGWIGSKSDPVMSPPPHVAILKVDVEALEHKVIVGATQLLQSHIVKNVFMEVSVRTDEEVQNGRVAIRVLIEAGYTLQGYGGFSGPGNPVPWQQDDPVRLIFDIMTAAKSVPVKQLNLWWTVA